MSTVYAVVNKLISLFLLVMIGYFLRRKNIVTQEFATGISAFLTKVVLPIFFVTTMQISFTPERFKTGITVYIFMLIIIIMAVVIGFITATVFGVKGADKGIWIYGCMLSNHAFIGFPIMKIIYGEEGLFYAAFANAALNTLVFSLGIVIMGLYAENTENKKTLKQLIITPMNVGTIIGITFFLLNIKLPAPIADSFDMLVNTMSALAMLFVGMVLSRCDLIDMFKGIKNYEMSFVRLIVLPLATFAILTPFKGILGEMGLGIIVISNALPVGSLLASVSAQYSDDPMSASRYIFVSTLLCVATIPFVSYLLI